MKKEFNYLFGFVRWRIGAPGLSFALGYWDKYVIIDCSSIFGFVISSGLISWRTPSQSSANPIASVAFCNASFGSHVAQSGHKPGATLSTKAPIALPSFQSICQFENKKISYQWKVKWHKNTCGEIVNR